MKWIKIHQNSERISNQELRGKDRKATQSLLKISDSTETTTTKRQVKQSQKGKKTLIEMKQSNMENTSVCQNSEQVSQWELGGRDPKSTQSHSKTSDLMETTKKASQKEQNRAKRNKTGQR